MHLCNILHILQLKKQTRSQKVQYMTCECEIRGTYVRTDSFKQFIELNNTYMLLRKGSWGYQTPYKIASKPMVITNK